MIVLSIAKYRNTHAANERIKEISRFNPSMLTVTNKRYDPIIMKWPWAVFGSPNIPKRKDRPEAESAKMDPKDKPSNMTTLIRYTMVDRSILLTFTNLLSEGTYIAFLGLTC